MTQDERNSLKAYLTKYGVLDKYDLERRQVVGDDDDDDATNVREVLVRENLAHIDSASDQDIKRWTALMELLQSQSIQMMDCEYYGKWTADGFYFEGGTLIIWHHR